MPFSLAIVAVVAGYTWIAQPLLGRGVVGLFGAVVLGLGVWHAWRSGDWGWSSRAFGPALIASAAFLTVIGAVLYAIARVVDSPLSSLDTGGVSADAAWLVIWAGAQQWLLQTTFLREAETRLGSRKARAPIVAALFFGALHLPNPALTALTTVAALGWSAIYQRYPNVVPLALSHAAGTVLFEALFDEAVTGRLRVGASYLAL